MKSNNRNLRLYSFEWVHLFISIGVILWKITTLIVMDNNGIRVSSRIGNHSDISWLFTQFTWWTNILITIWYFIKLILIKYKIENKFSNILFGTNNYVYWLSYINVVGTLFTAGTIYLMIKENLHENKKLISLEHDLSGLLYISNILITIFVHFINPIVYTILFVILLKRKLLPLEKEETYKKWIIKRISLGMIFPLIYMVFYVCYSFTNYDPYPISDIKNGEGLWIAPIIPIVFSSFLFMYSTIVFKRATGESSKANVKS